MDKLATRIGLTILGLAIIAGAGMLGYLAGLRLDGNPDVVSPDRVLDAGDSGTEGGTARTAPTAAGPSEWLEIPAPAAEFEALDGTTVRLADYRGGLVLLNFWGTWCPPCVHEIPELVALQPRLEELGGTVLGPAIDSGSPDRIRSFLDDFGVNYPIVIASNSQAIGDFGAAGYPTTLLVDAEGVIRRRYLGPQTAEGLLADVRRLMEGAPPNDASP